MSGGNQKQDHGQRSVRYALCWWWVAQKPSQKEANTQRSYYLCYNEDMLVDLSKRQMFLLLFVARLAYRDLWTYIITLPTHSIQIKYIISGMWIWQFSHRLHIFPFNRTVRSLIVAILAMNLCVMLKIANLNCLLADWFRGETFFPLKFSLSFSLRADYNLNGDRAIHPSSLSFVIAHEQFALIFALYVPILHYHNFVWDFHVARECGNLKNAWSNHACQRFFSGFFSLHWWSLTDFNSAVLKHFPKTYFNKQLHNMQWVVSEMRWKLSITSRKFNTSLGFSMQRKLNVSNRMYWTPERLLLL